MNINSFYPHVGVRNVGNLSDPEVTDAEMIDLPTESEIHWLRFSDYPDVPQIGSGVFSNIKEHIILNKYKYVQPKGLFKDTKLNKVDEIVRKQRNQNPKLMIAKPKQGLRRLKRNQTVIYSYGLMNHLREYRLTPDVIYYKWYNVANAYFSNIRNDFSLSARTRFLTINVPEYLPKSTEFEKYAGGRSQAMLMRFNTPEKLMILEFWRFLTPEFRKETVIDHITEVEDMSKIIFMFVFRNRVSFIRLSTLVEMVSEYSDDHGHSYKTIRKTILLFFKKLTDLAGDFNDIINQIDDTEKKSELADDSKIEETDDNIDLFSNTIVTDVSREYESLEELLNESPDQKKRLVEKIALNKKAGNLSKRDEETLTEYVEMQDYVSSPYDSNVKLQDELDYSKVKKEITEDDYKLPQLEHIKNKKMLTNPNGVLATEYMKHYYRKDLMNVIYGLQSSGVVIKQHHVDITGDNILGVEEHHRIEIKPLNGKPSVLKFKLPKVNEDGSFDMSGNKYVMVKQRGEKPIHKKGPNEVVLSTYYGKTFIVRHYDKAHDIGFALQKQINQLSLKSDDWSNLIPINYDLKDNEVPKLYAIIARYINHFDYKNIAFDFKYNERDGLLKGTDYKLNKIEKNGLTLIGKQGKKVYLLSNDDRLHQFDGKEFTVKSDNFLDFLGIDLSKLPVEAATMKVFKERIGVGVVLAYYLGIDQLIKLTKADVQFYKPNERVVVKHDEFILKFKDKKLVLKRNNIYTMLIFGGFDYIKKHIKDIEYDSFNARDTFPAIFTKIGFKSLHINEIKLMENMFVDPISKDLLSQIKEPLTYIGLLFRAVELLVDARYKEPNSLYGVVYRGNERIPGMLYTELVNSMRTYENKSVFSKSAVTLHPYVTWQNIGGDSTTMLDDNLNPLVNLKLRYTITSLGAGGRSKESMSKETRIFDITEVGIGSEATKDSGNAGVSYEQSAASRITNLRGIPNLDKSNLEHHELWSVSTMLAFNGNRDDPKRINYTNIQNSHTIPISEMHVPYLRTGYESVFPYLVGEKDCYNAEEDGVVKNKTKGSLTVEYKSGKKKTVKLGEWYTKEEAGSTYTHEVVSFRKKGEKFKKGYNLTYNSSFFEKDFFSPEHVVYRVGTSALVAITDETFNFEDSSLISEKLINKVTSSTVKIASHIVDVTDEILNLVKIGDKVKEDDKLFIISSQVAGDGVGLKSERSLEFLQNLKNASPSAKYKGEIVSVEVFYNAETYEMSKSLQEIVADSDKRMISNNSDDQSKIGKVTSAYSINGVPLINGKVHIKIRIKKPEGMGLGDKLVFSNQIKSTVGNIAKYPIKTKETNQDILAKFGNQSLAARIVTTPFSVGAAGIFLDETARMAVEKFFGK
jgi:hypothetical protein